MGYLVAALSLLIAFLAWRWQHYVKRSKLYEKAVLLETRLRKGVELDNERMRAEIDRKDEKIAELEYLLIQDADPNELADILNSVYSSDPN